MIGAVNEEVSCCFNILTAITHWGYATLISDYTVDNSHLLKDTTHLFNLTENG